MMESDDHMQTTGVAINFWKKHAGPQMGVAVEAFGPFPIIRTQKLLEDGLIDVIPNMTTIPERENTFLFSESPHSETTACIVVLKKIRCKKITHQENLYNFRMVHLDKAFILHLLRHETIKIELVTGDDYFHRFIEMIQAGRTDAFVHINYFSLKYELMVHGKKMHTESLSCGRTK